MNEKKPLWRRVLAGILGVKPKQPVAPTHTSPHTPLKVIRVQSNPKICHNGTCMNPKAENVLGPYCSWMCRNEDNRYDR